LDGPLDMALTYNPKANLGESLPSFLIKDVFGKEHDLQSLAQGKVFCLMFICNHCPYVKAIEDRLIELAHAYREKGAQFAGVCSNDPTDHPEDTVENLKKRAEEKNYGFPYLVDESQEVAQKIGAVCTPDLFLYDKDSKLFYRGRLDDSWRNPSQVKSQDLKMAIDAALSGMAAPKEQIPSMGCSIKWKEG